MSRSWSKEDRVHYGNSEVMQELEKSIIDTLKRLDILQKKAAAKSNVEEVNPKVQKSFESLNSTVKDLGSSLDDLGGTLGAASDGELDSVASEDDEDEEDTKNAIISDLRDLIKSAIEKDDVALAYQIERTIGEILEEDG